MDLSKEQIALIAAVIAGIVSLIVAALNLLTTSRITKLGRRYDLLKLDLERLEKIQDENGFLDYRNCHIQTT